MSGISIAFRRIYSRHSFSETVRELSGAMVSTLTPMLAVLLVLYLEYATLDYDSLRYLERSLLSVSLTYAFVFALLINSLYSNILAKYLGDVLYIAAYDAVMPAYKTGLLLTMGTASVLGGAFNAVTVLWGGVDAAFAFLSLNVLLGMTLVFYNMTFTSATKRGGRVAGFFSVSLALAFVLSHLLAWLGLSVSTAIQLSLIFGFTLLSALQYAYLRACFPHSDGSVRGVLPYFKTHGLLQLSAILYMTGLFAHNFVYWFSDLGVTIYGCYRYSPTYDKAAFLGMYTNALAGVILLSQLKSHFQERYKEFTAIINTGRLADIRLAESRVFRMLAYVRLNAAKMQFICATALFFLFTVALPAIGFYGLTSDMYPCLAAGYFALYVMYDQMTFLNYMEDQVGSFFTSLIFLSATVVFSFVALRFLPYDWQGIGLFIGALCGWAYSYFRVEWLEKRFDEHMFCVGTLVKKRFEPMPDGMVYQRKNAEGMNQA